jgi:hypothetical protein
MPWPTTPAFCVKWRDNKCSSKAGERIRKDPMKHHIWISQRHVPHCLSRQKILWKRMSGSALSSESSGFSDVRRFKSPCGTTVARPCQYMVGKLCSRSADEFKLAFREHYIPEGVLHMKQEEFMKLKQGGDTVTQYLNKFNHLSQYAIDQVNMDLKKRNCFMRGLNDRMQRKMATCIDLSYGRAVSTVLAVEAKYAGSGKSKGNGGDKPNQGSEKRQRLVIRPFNQNRSSSRPPSYPFKQPVFIHPITAPTATNQPGAPGTRFPALLSSSTACFNCGKSGYFIKDCPYPKQNRSSTQ